MYKYSQKWEICLKTGSFFILSVSEHFPCSLQILLLAGFLLGQNECIESVFAHPAFTESQVLLILTDAENCLVTGLILPQDHEQQLMEG